MNKSNFNWFKFNSPRSSYIYLWRDIDCFTIWMVFIDSHSLVIHRELNKEIKKLEKRKKGLETIIENDRKIVKQLKNIDSLEKVL